MNSNNHLTRSIIIRIGTNKKITIDIHLRIFKCLMVINNSRTITTKGN